ncbi:MAG: hypothetical protein GXO10_00850 [Crenarchaeota archaeon]|nr:hypothetical protein [Thermoproteota archaeon]
MSRYVIIATAGRPADWNVVKYEIDGHKYTTCASFIALAKHLKCRDDSDVKVIVVFPDSVDRNDIKCLISEFEKNDLRDYIFIFTEVEGNIGGRKFQGDLYAVPAVILCLSSIYFLDGFKIVFDLTHGWNILPSLTMYSISLIKKLVNADIYIAEPCITRTGFKCGDTCDSDKINVILKMHMISMPISARLFIDLCKVNHAIRCISTICSNFDVDVLNYIVNCVEYFSNGVITLGWYYMYKIFEKNNFIENMLREFLERLLEDELKIPEDVYVAHLTGRRVVKNETVEYRIRCPREALFQLLYEILRFIVIIRIFRELGYRGSSVPGLSIEFHKLEELLDRLSNVGIIDKALYLVTINNLKNFKRECSYASRYRDFCEYEASKRGSDKKQVNVIDLWRDYEKDRNREKMDRICRNVVAHSGLVCPIVKRCSMASIEINRDLDEDICDFGNDLIRYLLSS